MSHCRCWMNCRCRMHVAFVDRGYNVCQLKLLQAYCHQFEISDIYTYIRSCAYRNSTEIDTCCYSCDCETTILLIRPTWWLYSLRLPLHSIVSLLFCSFGPFDVHSPSFGTSSRGPSLVTSMIWLQYRTATILLQRIVKSEDHCQYKLVVLAFLSESYCGVLVNCDHDSSL